jgi:hypothetical protein
LANYLPKKIQLNVYGQTYQFYQTPDRRWYEVFKGKIEKTSGNRVKNLIWLFGDKAQREQERLERQQLFQRLEQKRQRQQSNIPQDLREYYESSDIRRYFETEEEAII